MSPHRKRFVTEKSVFLAESLYLRKYKLEFYFMGNNLDQTLFLFVHPKTSPSLLPRIFVENHPSMPILLA